MSSAPTRGNCVIEFPFWSPHLGRRNGICPEGCWRANGSGHAARCLAYESICLLSWKRLSEPHFCIPRFLRMSTCFCSSAFSWFPRFVLAHLSLSFLLNLSFLPHIFNFLNHYLLILLNFFVPCILVSDYTVVPLPINSFKELLYFFTITQRVGIKLHQRMYCNSFQ